MHNILLFLHAKSERQYNKSIILLCENRFILTQH